ncbi:hypothetical protein [Kitasatospora sp. LaBMicrA B282]|uniref:hypothetical protein n=1 Tax=Kitasatospora sp. LaBMicrA B282 TaxID=3420949 RepID=UPI003D0FA826
MQRVVMTKRTVAVAIAGLVVGTVGALSVPALASSEKPQVAPVQAMTLDFSGTNDETNVPQTVGTTFGGTAVVKDTGGNVIGKAYDICAKDVINPNADTVFCTGTVRVTNGQANGEISFSAVLPISDNAAAPATGAFTGVINGGTDAFEGITGEAKFKPQTQGVFDVNFS